MATRACNLITDSCCELTRAYLDEHEVGVLHFTYTEAGKADGGLCGVDDLFESRTPEEFYGAIAAGAAPMTSQPSPAEFEQAFRAAIESGVPTVVITLSSGISGCYNGAVAVLDRLKEEYGQDVPLYVVDSLIGSAAQTLLVVEAIRQRDAGLTATEMVAWLEEARYRVRVSFMVDDLEYLRRGGRIPSAAAKIGSLLGVKAMLGFAVDGSLSFAGVARGRKKALRKLMDDVLEERQRTDAPHGEDLGCVILGNAACSDDAAVLAAQITAADPELHTITVNIGPTIGCHVGPGMMACCFWGADRRG